MNEYLKNMREYKEKHGCYPWMHNLEPCIYREGNTTVITVWEGSKEGGRWMNVYFKEEGRTWINSKYNLKDYEYLFDTNIT